MSKSMVRGDGAVHGRMAGWRLNRAGFARLKRHGEPTEAARRRVRGMATHIGAMCIEMKCASCAARILSRGAKRLYAHRRSS